MEQFIPQEQPKEAPFDPTKASEKFDPNKGIVENLRSEEFLQLKRAIMLIMQERIGGDADRRKAVANLIEAATSSDDVLRLFGDALPLEKPLPEYGDKNSKVFAWIRSNRRRELEFATLKGLQKMAQDLATRLERSEGNFDPKTKKLRPEVAKTVGVLKDMDAVMDKVGNVNRGLRFIPTSKDKNYGIEPPPEVLQELLKEENDE